MNAAGQLEEARDEALRKIGRNVVNFQRMEALLRLLAANRPFSGTPQEFVRMREKVSRLLARKPMGMLAESFIEAAYSDFPESAPDGDDAKEIHIHFRLSLKECDETRIERRKALMFIVEERNKLIHQLAAEFDTNSIDSCRKLSIALDEQREQMLPEFNFLKEIARMVLTHAEEVRELVDSNEFRSQFGERADDA